MEAVSALKKTFVSCDGASVHLANPISFRIAGPIDRRYDIGIATNPHQREYRRESRFLISESEHGSGELVLQTQAEPAAGPTTGQ